MNWYLKVLQQYADFKGRARRKEYWMFFLINILISITINVIVVLLDLPSFQILDSIYSIAVLIPSLAVGVRRMHDVGKSGWFLLIPFYSLYLACLDSEPGPNNWGENPKEISDDSDINLIGTE
ncbi:MAG: DUF805 domain-containing protein [Oceanihabitans sp.]|nr:DUF805 domain-containing protein [Oceanihabitans sp.]